MPKRYVVTGAPGAGKTALVRGLQERGWAVVEEAATEVIAREQARGVDEPWTHGDFVSKIAALQRDEQQRSVPADVGVQFYDRSPLCTLALARYMRLPVTSTLAHEVARVDREQVYERTAFFVRPIGFVEPTAARRISYPESLEFEAVHEETYRDHGFTIVDVAPASVAERTAAVEEHVTARW
ncbi:putative ATPase [Saccharopolyspora lacisalsi]|uniref:Putative ATPase n=1 Tax=Halosaccharopolyspora lacisalsi TaxID=1000566 RepID=A0A839DUH9_9PSEU|nr:AAA family ATPase [Halosaccharopolyspora lacisalsi]MBA8824703.1 putative ATPase [Halosaccharopolyspora lacisalsi]